AGPGRDVRLTILRAEGRRRLDVKLASMPRSVVGDRIGAEFGFVLREPETPAPSALSVGTLPPLPVVVPPSPPGRAGPQGGGHNPPGGRGRGPQGGGDEGGPGRGRPGGAAAARVRPRQQPPVGHAPAARRRLSSPPRRRPGLLTNPRRLA